MQHLEIFGITFLACVLHRGESLGQMAAFSFQPFISSHRPNPKSLGEKKTLRNLMGILPFYMPWFDLLPILQCTVGLYEKRRNLRGDMLTVAYKPKEKKTGAGKTAVTLILESKCWSLKNYNF